MAGKNERARLLPNVTYAEMIRRHADAGLAAQREMAADRLRLASWRAWASSAALRLAEQTGSDHAILHAALHQQVEMQCERLLIGALGTHGER